MQSMDKWCLRTLTYRNNSFKIGVQLKEGENGDAEFCFHTFGTDWMLRDETDSIPTPHLYIAALPPFCAEPILERIGLPVKAGQPAAIPLEDREYLSLLDWINNAKAKFQRSKLESQDFPPDLGDEYMVFDKTEFQTPPTYELLHSLGCLITEGGIYLYTPKQAAHMGMDAVTTYELRDTLYAMRFSTNNPRHQWRIANNEGNRRMVMDLLKRFDTRALPSDYGLVRCPQTGEWVKQTQLQTA